MSQSPYKNLFLAQSYADCLVSYEKALSREDYPTWDYVVLTAANINQAKAYSAQIEYRLSLDTLPKRTKYLVIEDIDGKRIGSGGATLNVLSKIAKEEGSSDFSGKKILCIHSGGDSKRIPQYSSCGKIFSPVPRTLPSGRRSTLFDEILIGMSGVPSRMEGGMLVCSGDVLLLFNPLQIDFYSNGAACLSIKENVITGSHHGVFTDDENKNVGDFLHKLSPEELTSRNAVDKNNNVNIDTGAIILHSNVLNSLYSLIDTNEKFDQLINERVRLSFYGDFIYPMTSRGTLEGFLLEKPEGEMNDELISARKKIWQILSPYRIKLIRLSPASFLHFGTTREMLSLMCNSIEEYSYLGWKRHTNSYCIHNNVSTSNSYVSPNASIGSDSYIEDSYIGDNVTIGKGCVISSLELDNVNIPDGVVLHGLKLKDSSFTVRMYSVDDNPKENKWFDKPLNEPLWNARLFPVRSTMPHAVNDILSDNSTGELTSLQESSVNADTQAFIDWQERINNKLTVTAILNELESGTSVNNICNNINKKNINKKICRDLLDIANKQDISQEKGSYTAIRIYYCLWLLTGIKQYYKECFDILQKTVLLSSSSRRVVNGKIARDDITVNLPVRVNWGGGWSDTPPYCLENGGCVLNAAVVLDGEYPIEVTLKKIDENKIILASTDIGSYKEFDSDISVLLDCKDPHDAFSLHKASLIACGVIKDEDNSISDVTKRIGGGIYMNTRVINIPKGSGLGTSSILACACVRAIFDLFNEDISDNELFEAVMCTEQIMSTGGGWQDQVGGYIPGIKLISTTPGTRQIITYKSANISDDTLKTLNERFILIYTGQRRLARNLLREVVGKYIEGDNDAVFVLGEIQGIAKKMLVALENGNINSFAHLLNEHWELSKRLDKECTNTCIDQILLSVDDLIDGRMICGAGGGGFLQVIMKEGINAETLSTRLEQVFADSGVSVYKCSFCM